MKIMGRRSRSSRGLSQVLSSLFDQGEEWSRILFRASCENPPAQQQRMHRGAVFISKILAGRFLRTLFFSPLRPPEVEWALPSSFCATVALVSRLRETLGRVSPRVNTSGTCPLAADAKNHRKERGGHVDSTLSDEAQSSSNPCPFKHRKSEGACPFTPFDKIACNDA